MKIAVKLTLGFLTMTAIIIVLGFFAYLQLLSVEKPLQKELAPSIEKLSGSLRVNGAVSLIRYYDEVLTQSARNYVFTNDTTWKTRYFKFESEMERTVREAKNAVDAFDRKNVELFVTINASNDALVRMETRAISLADEGKRKEAAMILESGEYADEKLRLVKKVEEYFSRRGGSFESALEDSTITLKITEKLIGENVNRSIKFSVLLSIVAVALSVLLGVVLGRMLTKPIYQLTKASSEIEKGNLDVIADVETGDELQDLARDFNHAIASLRMLERKRKEIDTMKNEFLSITSHELRSPMTPIIAQLQMLLKGYFGRLKPKQKSSMQIVLNNTRRLDTIIKDLLEVSRIEAGRLKFKWVFTNLRKEVGRLMEEMRWMMPEKKIRVDVRIGRLPKIECDPDRVMQVLRNMVNNAIKFSKDKGRVVVTINAHKDELRFMVKDFGIGIPKKSLSRIFEPFYQGEETMYRKYGGTGLGLTIAKSIVELQNGKIWVKSVEGKGTTFFFTVPFKPTKETKPFNLLMHYSEQTEKKVEETLRKYFGPTAEREFSLIAKKGMRLDVVMQHMDKLMKNGVITPEIHAALMNEFYRIFKFLPRSKKRRSVDGAAQEKLIKGKEER